MAESRAKPRSRLTDKRVNRNIRRRARLHRAIPVRLKLAGSYKMMQAPGPAAINSSRVAIAAAPVAEAAVQGGQAGVGVVVEEDAGDANC